MPNINLPVYVEALILFLFIGLPLLGCLKWFSDKKKLPQFVEFLTNNDFIPVEFSNIRYKILQSNSTSQKSFSGVGFKVEFDLIKPRIFKRNNTFVFVYKGTVTQYSIDDTPLESNLISNTFSYYSYSEDEENIQWTFSPSFGNVKQALIVK